MSHCRNILVIRAALDILAPQILRRGGVNATGEPNLAAVA